MTQDDTRDTGIPTRAIHETYLNMQEAHRGYRQVRDDPGADETNAHAAFQDAVLTFYELIRPHLKRKGSMSSFWEGELPDYPDRWWDSVEQAQQFCLEYGTAVWSLQKHVQTMATSPNTNSGADPSVIADGGASTPADWHRELNLSDNQRVVAVERQEGVLTWIELRAVTGLKKLDRWDTREKRRREKQDGFMSGETTTTIELEYVPVWKLTQAKRLLAEAADKMSMLSRVDIDHEDGAIVNFDQSRDDVQPEYRDAEYDSSPDI